MFTHLSQYRIQIFWSYGLTLVFVSLNMLLWKYVCVQWDGSIYHLQEEDWPLLFMDTSLVPDVPVSVRMKPVCLVCSVRSFVPDSLWKWGLNDAVLWLVQSVLLSGLLLQLVPAERLKLSMCSVGVSDWRNLIFCCCPFIIFSALVKYFFFSCPF